MNTQKPAALQLPDGSFSFSLSSYEPVNLELPEPELTEDEVLRQLEYFMYQHADIVPIEEERAIKMGDIVTLDMKTKIEGEEIEQLSGEKLNLELGIGLMPPAFEEALCKLQKGADETIKYELGEDKKQIETQVHIHEINERIIPAMTDAWIQKNTQGYSSIPEFAAGMRTQMIQQKKAEIESQSYAKITDILAERLEQAVPQELIEDGYRVFRENFEAMLKMQGSTREEFLQLQGIDPQIIEEAERKEAELGVTRGVALDAYVKHFKLEVERTEIPELLGVDPAASEEFLSALEKDGALDDARVSALRNKAMRMLAEQSTITFVSKSTE